MFDTQITGGAPAPARPADGKRPWLEAAGLRRVMVDGVTAAVDGEATDVLSGTVLRSGRHTETVPAGR